MGQIINAVCVCQCVCLCLSVRLSRLHFLIDFRQKWQRSNNPQKYERVHWGQYRTTPSHILPPKPLFWAKVLKIHANLYMPISACNDRKLPEFPRQEIGVKEHNGDNRFQTGSRNKAVAHVHIEK